MGGLATSEGRVVLLFDEGCGVCIWVVAMLLRHASGSRLVAAGIGSAAGDRWLDDLPLNERWASWHAVDAAGRRYSGGAVLPVVLCAAPGGRFIAGLAGLNPSLTEWGYRLAARRRRYWSRLVPRRSVSRARDQLAANLQESNATGAT